MIKIGYPSMSEAFEPPVQTWSGVLPSQSTLDIFEEYYNDEWRKGTEIREVVVSQRLYQIDFNSTQA